MKGQFNVTFTAKEAVWLLSFSELPKSLTTKIVTAFRNAPITPVGRKNSIVSRATAKPKKARKAKLEAVKNNEEKAA